MTRLASLTLGLSVFLAACGSEPAADAGAPDASSPDAARDSAAIDAPAADAAHCTTDDDGDGHRSIACGGDDCDDGDPNAYPGNAEVCDATNHDEDCDPRTSGTRDNDHDGYSDSSCCNTDHSTGTMNCGDDCNDMSSVVHPTAPEVCDTLDNDCNDLVDDGVLVDFHPDCDNDHSGAAGSAPITGCMAPPTAPATCPGGTWSANAADCDDTAATVYPGATETCNGVDDDCDTVIDGAPATTWCNGAGLPANTTAATCTSAVCAPDTCASPYLDCTSGTSGAGCETDGSTGRLTCGSCSHVCPWSCAASTCDDIIGVASGSHEFTCLVQMGGEVYCWGQNSNGQLGNGTTTDSAVPLRVAGIADAAEVVTGRGTVCVRRRSGAVTCWGRGMYGVIGDGTTVDRLAPGANVTGLTDAVELSAGDDQICARRATGDISCWGRNGAGGLGDGTTAERDTPVAVTGIHDAISIAVGPGGACAVRATGRVLCWGANGYRQLGDGVFHTSCATYDCSPTPVTVSGITDAMEVAAIGFQVAADQGHGSFCARHATGSVSCWGSNEKGQLGDGTTSIAFTPVTVTGLTDAVEIEGAVDGDDMCARRTSGAVVCWGDNASGQIGDGTMTDRHVPTAVSGLTDAIQVSLSGPTASTTGHACAVRATHEVVCWGLNMHSELGDRTAVQRTTPVMVIPPP